MKGEINGAMNSPWKDQKNGQLNDEKRMDECTNEWTNE